MKIFVAGATGVLGRRAVEQLVRTGHDVAGAARSPEKAALLSGLGATPVEIDVFDPTAVGTAVSGHDVVMNLATRIPALSKSAFPSAWKENDRIRTDLSKLLVDAAIAADAKRYIQESIAFTYEDRGDSWIDEDVPLDTPKRVTAVRDAEASAQRFTASGGVGVVLRFGMFYGADTPHTQFQLSAAQRGILPFPGPRDGYVSLIQLDDAAAAVVAAMRMMARSQRVSNERFKKASGWEPRYASARDGLPSVIAEMQSARAASVR